MRRSVALGCLVLLLSGLIGGLALVGGFALAAEGEAVTVAVSPTRLEFVGAAGLAATQEVRVAITGGAPGTVALGMRDAFIDADGRWRDAAYGSTVGSLKGILTIEPRTFTYEPDGGTQTFTARLRVDADRVLGPLAGSLVAVLAPTGEPGATVVQQAGVAIRILAGPTEETIAALPAEAFSLAIGELEVGGGSPFSPLGAVLPGLPGVVGRRPLGVSTSVRNTGTVFLDTHVTYAFTRLSPLAVLSSRFGGRPHLVLNQAPRFVLPGQRYDDAATTRPGDPADDERLDAAPFIGFFRVSAQATGTVAGRSVASEVRTRTVLVFPWAESLVGLASYVVLRSSKRSRRRRARRRGAPHRDIPATGASHRDIPTTTAPRATTAPRTTTTAPRATTDPRPPATKVAFGEWWAARGRETERRMADAAGERGEGSPASGPRGRSEPSSRTDLR